MVNFVIYTTHVTTEVLNGQVQLLNDERIPNFGG